MSKDIIIFGGGETALLAYEYFTHDSDYHVVAFSMDREYMEQSELMGLPIVAIDEVTQRFPCSEYHAFVAASSTKLNRVRRQLFEKARDMGYTLVSYISSKAFVWPNASIGENCFILEDNTIQPFTQIGNNVVMWSGNHLGHRSVIGDHCFISSHCVISGFCDIGDSSFLGVNCTLEDNVKIGKDNFLGAGSLIRKATPDKAFYQEEPTELSKVETHKLLRIKE
ncbi:acetyltransferase [Pseudomonas sp. HR96]|uniref:acetyltransferase n=1 Tax=Pseudomonas sp. HR96 TaxID=1027966 RepID=UPI002A759446|nr:acetyltransferase [Pseudomonas sp. HR96]WPO98870.1 acetyltransferase [Pseudomonas sp. HR96]